MMYAVDWGATCASIVMVRDSVTFFVGAEAEQQRTIAAYTQWSDALHYSLRQASKGLNVATCPCMVVLEVRGEAIPVIQAIGPTKS